MKFAVITMGDEEEDPVCPYPKITEACKPQCSAQFASYEVSVLFVDERTIRRHAGWKGRCACGCLQSSQFATSVSNLHYLLAYKCSFTLPTPM